MEENKLGVREILATNDFLQEKAKIEKAKETKKELKEKLKKYRASLVAEGKMKPEEILNQKDIEFVLRSLGYKERSASQALKKAWGVSISFGDLQELMRDPKFWS